MTTLLLGLLLAQQLQVAPQPKSRPESIENALVILEGVVNEAGRLTEVRVMQGPAPFIQPSLDSVKEWEFTPPAEPQHVSVTFLYRARTILPDKPNEFAVQTTCCALPTYVVDPGYPVDSVGEGSVILRVKVNAHGALDHVSVVRREPSLTEAAVNAVRRWKFETDRPADAVVVISFLRPVLSSQ
jgi:TonB family protein